MYEKHAVAIVRYENDPCKFVETIKALSKTYRVFVYDNSILPITDYGENVTYIHNASNPGLGFALNQVISTAKSAGYETVTYFDQDSEMNVVLVDQLICNFTKLRLLDECVIACGPQPLTADGKNYPINKSDNFLTPSHVECSELITSGMTFDLNAATLIGGFNEALFLDLVDFEFCWRAVKKGYKVILCRNVTMMHQVGEMAINIFGRLLPISKPMRNYYQIRNLILIYQQDNFASHIVGVRYIFRRFVNILLNLMLAERRAERILWNIRGIRDGILQRGGQFSVKK